MWSDALSDLILSIFLMAFRVFSARFLSYLSGLLRFLSNSNVESWCKKKRNRNHAVFWYKHCNNAIKSPKSMPQVYHLCHVLSMQTPIGLGPFYFTGIPLHLEVLVAFRSTETENLQMFGPSEIKINANSTNDMQGTQYYKLF